MDENLGSFKSLENVFLKATYDMEINGREFKEGEIVASFDKIQVSGLQEIKDYVAARGGVDNRAHVYWETTRELKLNFSQGVFSNTMFGLFTNAKILKIEQDEPILVSNVEELESNENGSVFPKYQVYDQLFAYNKDTGEPVNAWVVGSWVNTDIRNGTIVISYRFNYLNGGSIAKIGQRVINGFLELEGRTRVKDDTSGRITTGIIKIPKLKLMSGLSIRLGDSVSPVIGNFQAVGIPVESRRDSYVVEIDFLTNDLDSDM